MAKVFWTAILVVIQAVDSYILLTANIDDLNNIGRRVVQSPIGGQVSSIVRRAYSVFNNKLGKARVNMRADDEDIVLAYKPDDNTVSRRKGDLRDRSDDIDDERKGSNEEDPNTFSALGRSASVYLKKIKKIFEQA